MTEHEPAPPVPAAVSARAPGARRPPGPRADRRDAASATEPSPGSPASSASAPSPSATGSARPRSTAAAGPGLTTEERARMQRARAREPRAPPGQRDPEERLGFLRGGARPPLAAMIRFIDEHRDAFGVEPICRTLADRPVDLLRRQAPAALGPRGPRRDAWPTIVGRVHRGQLRRVRDPQGLEGPAAARASTPGATRSPASCAPLGLAGATRTQAGPDDQARARSAQRPADLVERVFAAPAPNRLWVADLTYVWTRAGLRATRRSSSTPSAGAIVGWRVMATPARRARPRRPRDGDLGRAARTSPASSTTPTAASSTSRSATPSASPRPRRRRLGREPRATATTTPSPRPSTGCTRPSSSTGPGPGARSTRSSSPPPTGSTAGTPSGSTRPAATSRRPSSRPPTMPSGR